MLDIPGYPRLNKDSLIGGCIRLRRTVDAERLRREFEQLPAECWGSRGGRVGVHNPAEALFLRGYAPAEGDKPVEDRPALALLPYVRALIYDTIGATPLRCLLAKLPAGASIAPHIDRAPYFSKTIRLHIPVISNPEVWMYCGGEVYTMRPGEVWALNNCTVHAVWNAHATDTRTHLICDFLPSDGLLTLLRDGERDLGQRNARVEEHFSKLPQTPDAYGPAAT